MSFPSILVAEDEPAIRDLLAHHLEREAFVVLPAADGQAAMRIARVGVDAAILDVGLPGIDGLEVTRMLRREHRDLPILILTARSDEIDRVVGFEVGADDYVCKPFSPREVVARVKALLRRVGAPTPMAQRVLRFGRLEIDEAAREARVDGSDLHLKPREFSLLLELARNAGFALTRERLLEKVWGIDYDGDERTIDVHIRRLRRRLDEEAALPQMLETVHGFGYKFQRG